MAKYKKKCRILKYETYYDLIEQSYANENELTVYEALGYQKTPYGQCWQLEVISVEEQFNDYLPSDFNIKVLNLNTNTLEVNELFCLRLRNNSSVANLREEISKKLKCEAHKIRMALERPHSACNYVYLNEQLEDTLKSKHFNRSNKVCCN
jgi:hypothetical protein